MKNIYKYLILLLSIVVLSSCTDSIMDDVNKDLNHSSTAEARLLLPSVIVESAFGTTGTDIAWYSSVYIEHSAGTFGQLQTADTRAGCREASLFNNSWNSIYTNLMICKDIMTKCSPTGNEPGNYYCLGIAQLLSAYNLAVLTDMWGQVPWTQALQGSSNYQPAYDKQQNIYNSIFTLLDASIANFSKTTNSVNIAKYDLIYGGVISKWKKAAYSLKARYYLRLSNRVGGTTYLDNALTAVTSGFATAADAFIFNKYEATATGENPWYQFYYDRSYLAVGKTLYDIMVARNDTNRIKTYFLKAADGTYTPAPNGTAIASQADGTYSLSALTDAGQTAATPLMTFHELKFIEAEARFRKGDAAYKTALQAGVEASFTYNSVTGGTAHYTNDVAPLLTSGNELKQIITEKYIAFYEFESIEAYNDYRRTGIPTLHNPANNFANYGFVNRLPYPTSEVTSNSAHIPVVDIFKDKVWWAGGTE
ncbi:MAG: SusD/RagB family nutrient-binding outer membrane lipoprotein [Bacteroidetes bacterium]|nr:SusD/RagB family nutrient-binding outer membrane lipoprotein [Bacteroidota bacterium]